MGLNATLPSIFTQISLRMRAVTGQRRPAWISASAMARHRSDRLPSGSPSEMRFPSVCRITPGSTISVPRYTIEPTTRARIDGGADHAAGVDALQAKPCEFARAHLEIPPRACRSACSRPWCSRRSAALTAAQAESGHAPSRRGRSHPSGPASPRSPMTRGRTSKSPSALSTRSPRSCIARRCGPRANSVTSWPARAMQAPM